MSSASVVQLTLALIIQLSLAHSAVDSGICHEFTAFPHIAVSDTPALRIVFLLIPASADADAKQEHIPPRVACGVTAEQELKRPGWNPQLTFVINFFRVATNFNGPYFGNKGLNNLTSVQ
ncbi:hypothetical protein B0H13DRAFT_2286945 [Mycena leptocephala]|nr:hypothetical protein B0H13DRAFT_2286945 [Mycena leptocephala]